MRASFSEVCHAVTMSAANSSGQRRNYPGMQWGLIKTLRMSASRNGYMIGAAQKRFQVLHSSAGELIVGFQIFTSLELLPCEKASLQNQMRNDVQ